MARILVIDDDRYIRSGCARIFQKDGWSVTCADDGDQGLKEILNSPDSYDVILLDLLMPGMSGIEVLAQILAFNPKLPVIIMTGLATADSVTEVVRKGAYGCIAKPFTPDELRTIVRKALKERPIRNEESPPSGT